MSQPNFWGNQDRAQSVVEERKTLNSLVAPLDEALKARDDLSAMIEMAEEDASFAEEVPAEIERLESLLLKVA